MPTGTSVPRVLTAAIIIEFGMATGGGNTSVIDSRKNWVVNKWANCQVQITKLSGTEYFADIISNTATQLNFAPLPGGAVVAPSDLYAIRATNDPAGARLIRWGRDAAPAWVHAAEVAAPAAGTVLVTRAVTAARSGYIYGFFISVQEANNFLINWISATVAYSKRLVFGAGGVIQDVEGVALNEGLPADAGTNITITNVTAAAALMVYQANLLYAEV